jgi:hypothetical protein
VLLTGSTASYALDFNIRVNIPGIGRVDTSHPLHPVETNRIPVPGGTVKPPEPGLVPTTPSVQLNKTAPGRTSKIAARKRGSTERCQSIARG